MRITRVAVTRVNIRLEAPYQWSPGWYHGGTKGIIEVETDDGLVGLGEVPTLDLADYVERRLAPVLVGRDAFDLDGCLLACVPEFRTVRNTHDDSALRAFGGVEIALWDLRGKAYGVPLHDLLGGAVRREIAFSEYFSLRQGRETTPEEVAAYCARMHEEHGSTIFEGKAGLGDVVRDVEIATCVRDAVGEDAVMRLDANMGWTPAEAEWALRHLEPLNISNVEDPVGDLDAMRRLRARTSIPFSTHVPALRYAARHGAPDRFVLGLTQLGGIRETLKFAAACELFGIGFWFYSGDSGIGIAAYLQLSAAVPYLEAPHQSLLRWYKDDVVVGGPFRPENNVVAVPEGPGLGVELDRDGLARCAEAFLLDGEVPQFDPGSGDFRRLRSQ